MSAVRFTRLPVGATQSSSSCYTAHLMDPSQPASYFLAWSPTAKVVTGYVWSREDFPWLGIWEENNNRTHTPWLGRTQTRGMELEGRFTGAHRVRFRRAPGGTIHVLAVENRSQAC